MTQTPNPYMLNDGADVLQAVQALIRESCHESARIHGRTTFLQTMLGGQIEGDALVLSMRYPQLARKTRIDPVYDADDIEPLQELLGIGGQLGIDLEESYGMLRAADARVDARESRETSPLVPHTCYKCATLRIPLELLDLPMIRGVCQETQLMSDIMKELRECGDNRGPRQCHAIFTEQSQDFLADIRHELAQCLERDPALRDFGVNDILMPFEYSPATRIRIDLREHGAGIGKCLREALRTARSRQLPDKDSAIDAVEGMRQVPEQLHEVFTALGLHIRPDTAEDSGVSRKWEKTTYRIELAKPLSLGNCAQLKARVNAMLSHLPLRECDEGGYKMHFEYKPGEGETSRIEKRLQSKTYSFMGLNWQTAVKRVEVEEPVEARISGFDVTLVDRHGYETTPYQIVDAVAALRAKALSPRMRDALREEETQHIHPSL